MNLRDDQMGGRLPTMRSTTVDVHGPVHLAEWGEGPVRIVLVHGLGGSHLNWMRVAPALARYGRVLAPDLAGFGLSPVAGRRASVPAQRALLHRLIRQTCDQPVLLAGNSMGGMIALAEAALHPECVAGLVLVDAVLPGPWRQRRPERSCSRSRPTWCPARPRPAPARSGSRLRRGPGGGCAPSLRGRFERVPADVVGAHVALERSRGRIPDDDAAYVLAARSIVLALAHPGAGEDHDRDGPHPGGPRRGRPAGPRRRRPASRPPPPGLGRPRSGRCRPHPDAGGPPPVPRDHGRWLRSERLEGPSRSAAVEPSVPAP